MSRTLLALTCCAVRTSGTFLMWLFDETRTFHTRADAVIESQLTDMTTASYRELLGTTLGFEAPLEAALAYTTSIGGLFELRYRSGYLVHDLLSLGMRPQEIALLGQCVITPFEDAATAAGWLYVYERSRLQQPALCMHIKTALPHVRGAMQYLCHDDIEVSKRWNAFASRLEALADERNAREAIRDAAIQAFQTQLAWFATSASARRDIASL